MQNLNLPSLIQGELEQHEQFLDVILLVQSICSFCCLISAFVISSNSYAGFIAVLTSMIYCGFSAISWYGIRYKTNRILFGAILGASAVLVVISLQTAIFWGQYSGCESYGSASNHSSSRIMTHRLLSGVECKNTGGMKGVCLFSVFMFLSYIVFIALLGKYKNEILAALPVTDGYSSAPDNSTTGAGFRAGYGGMPGDSASSSTPLSADL